MLQVFRRIKIKNEIARSWSGDAEQRFDRGAKEQESGIFEV